MRFGYFGGESLIQPTCRVVTMVCGRRPLILGTTRATAIGGEKKRVKKNPTNRGTTRDRSSSSGTVCYQTHRRRRSIAALTRRAKYWGK